MIMLDLAQQRISLIPAVKRFAFRPDSHESELLGRSGSLEVRLARSERDIKRAQKLRYTVFYSEMSANPDLKSRLKRRDIDPFDAICDHLLVIDTAVPVKNPQEPKVVGTYRLLRQDLAEQHGGFYSAQEFEIAPLLKAQPHLRFLELGRSCVEQSYRDKRTIELLWHGIWAYVRRHHIDVLFGCASFSGTDPDQHALSLSFLHQNLRAADPWQVKALPSQAISMNRLSDESLDTRQALQSMPPLIKAYMRLGARFADHAVIDLQFGTIDVLVILPVSAINPKYVGYFGADGSRYAA
jgi:putative hemolysin